MMGLMTAQPPLPLTPAGAVPFGDVAALLQDDDGGRVFIRGELCFVWDAGDEAGRRLAAVQLVRIKAALLMDVAAAFAVSTVTLWRWRKELDVSGVEGLASDKRGPKGPGPTLVRGQAFHARDVQLLAPTPQRDCGDCESGSHIHQQCGFDPHELDRGEPAAGFVPCVPHEAQLSPDEHPPTVVVL